MAQVIQLHDSLRAKAAGAFAAVNIAARRMGFSEELALRAARSARQRVLDRDGSPASVVADTKAELRADAPEQCA